MKKPPGFAPLHVNWNLLDSRRLEPLYQFAHLLFQGDPSGGGILKTLLSAESDIDRPFMNLPHKERDHLEKALEGLVIDLKFKISDKHAGEILSVPIHLEPARVMKRAILGRSSPTDFDRQFANIRKIVAEFVLKEFKKKMRESLQGFFKAEVVKAKVKAGVKELIRLGAITRKGLFASETTIEDLLSGKYADIFARVANREVVNEGILIRETFSGLCEWAELGHEAWAREARQELNLIGETLGALHNLV
ncbi:MAG: hypothetical protein HYU97_08120 [Deltaproteobacteria bacterium]|nr:hypothetical protein [Deltaproteobacteria bacterium]